MIYVTKEAKKELKTLLSTGENLRGEYLRIIDKGQGELGLVTDDMKPGDQVVEYEGKVLLVAEPALTSDLKNISLDAYKTSNIPRIIISEEVVNQLSTTVTVNWLPWPPASHPQN